MDVCRKHNCIMPDVQHPWGKSPVCWKCVEETRRWLSRLFQPCFAVQPTNGNGVKPNG